MKTPQKLAPSPPPKSLPDFFFMTPPDEIPHDKYNICDIVHTSTNRKDDIFM